MNAKVIVIGGGAAGMMAALMAAREGVDVLLLERNKQLGRKLAITGGGRCNLTNQAEIAELIANVPGNGRFLYSAFQKFDAGALMKFVTNDLHLPVKVERGRRVFPECDDAKQVVAAFADLLRRQGVIIMTGIRVKDLTLEDGQLRGVRLEDGREMAAQSVIVATGGLSYPGTGSTGDGYRWAETAGHSIIACFPSLVPLVTMESWPACLEGLSLTNVEATCFYQGKKIAADFGEMLFTGFGVSGPVILSQSRMVVPLVLKEPGSVQIRIDLKPALQAEELDKRVQRDFAEFSRKIYKNALDELLPQKLIPIFIELSGIEPGKPVHQITREERRRIVELCKGLPVTIKEPRSYFEAIITTGGVATKEINPKTMESKLIPGLFFAGEIIDVDAYTGGYNLQIAFSTGYLAGIEAARRINA